MTRIFTIGFTGSSAENFFGRLKKAGVRKVIDTRLWPGTQLSGFAKKKDLPYFLKELVGVAYEYRPELAPSENLLKDAKEGRMDWPEYESRYLELMNQRLVSRILTPDEMDLACLLCACRTPHHCHRRLLAEYLQREWSAAMEITHL